VQVAGDYVESWQPHPMRRSCAGPGLATIARCGHRDLAAPGIFVSKLPSRARGVFLEVARVPRHRMGDDGHAVENEFELHARALLGLPVDVGCANSGPAQSSTAARPRAMVFDGVAEALALPGVDLRLFGTKPESFVKRRMGFALATPRTSTAWATAKAAAAGCVPAPPVTRTQTRHCLEKACFPLSGLVRPLRSTIDPSAGRP